MDNKDDISKILNKAVNETNIEIEKNNENTNQTKILEKELKNKESDFKRLFRKILKD